MKKLERNSDATLIYRLLVHAFYGTEGNRELSLQPRAKILPAVYDEKHINLMRRIARLFIESDYTNEAIKRYLESNLTNRELADEFGVNFNTFKSKNWYHWNRIKNDIPSEHVYELMFNPKVDIKLLDKLVSVVESKTYDKNSSTLLKGIVLKVGKGEISTELSDTEFYKMLDIIRPYTKVAIQKAESELTKNMKDYLRYLDEYQSTLTNDVDKERVQELLGVIKGDTGIIE